VLLRRNNTEGGAICLTTYPGVATGKQYRLWRTIKYECVYLHEFESPKQARAVIAAYLNFYNNRRLHAALDYHTPAQVHFGQVQLVS
jgi:transposase InsO family protein